MEIVKLVLSILTVIFIGWNILYIISFRNCKLYFFERLFLSYGLGLGALSLQMFVLFLFNIRFGPIQIMSPWLLFFIINSIIARGKRKQGELKKIDYRHGPFTFFLLGAIIFEILYAFFRALIKPIEAYDAIAIYAIKSKIFYLAGSIPHDYFRAIGLLFPHPDYPLNIPLSETFVYLFLGGINEQLVKVIFPLYFVAILGILYFGIRRFAGSTYALVFTFILATIPQFNNFATNAYVDVPLAYYYLAGALLLFYWFRETTSTGFLYISAVLTALAGWTKNEGLVFCVVNIILLAVFLLLNRGKIKGRVIVHGLGYVVVISALLLPWLWVKNSAHLVNSDFGVLNAGQFNIIKQFYKIGPVFYEIQRQVFGPKKWNIIWVIIILAAIFYHKKIFTKDQVYITISLILIILAYMFASLFAQKEIVFLMHTVWSRLMIHFLPLAVYWLASLLKDEVKA